MLHVERISGGYSSIPVIRDLTLSVAPGEVVLIVGPNGAGKSTLLRLLIGLLHSTRGSVSVDGESIEGSVPDRVRRGIAYLPQRRAVFPSLSVSENLRLAGRHRHPMLDPWLRYIGTHDPNTKAGWLSGGQQRMLGLGMVLVKEPRVMLLDEPTAGLARPVSSALWEVTRQSVRQSQCCAVVVEQRTDALHWCDRALLLREGQIVAQTRNPKDWLDVPVLDRARANPHARKPDVN